MSNPNYAVLLPQIPSLSGQAKLDKINETFVFSVPLTISESQLFEYGSYAYMQYTPNSDYLSANPSSDNTAYVGNYEGFPPVFSTGETLPQAPISPNPPETSPPDIPLPPGTTIDTDDVAIITPVVEEYCSISSDIQLDEINHWVESELLIMENEYEQWIDETYLAAG